jgi:propanol-preferring alcohol dehydrogenase
MRVGARVVQGCGHCQWCAAGEETACPNKVFYADNGHSELFKLGLQGVHLIPEGVAWPAAAILTGDGLGVPARCARRLGDTSGKKVLVLGLGPVGLSCVLVQTFRGATVSGVDVSAYRLDLAEKLGAAHAFDAAKDALQDRVMDWTAGLGADIVILAVAREESLRQAFELVRRHGTVFQVAELGDAQLNFSKCFLRREATMMGSWYYTSEDWPFMLDLHRKGLRYEKLITHVVPLERAQEGFDAFVAGRSGKVVLTP